MSDKYEKAVRQNAAYLQKVRTNDNYGAIFMCPTCGTKRYLLSDQAKEWFQRKDRVMCKACGFYKTEFKGRMGEREAVHKNNIRRRGSGDSMVDRSLIR